MRFSLFRRENNEAARRERQEQLEKRVVDGFRQLSGLLHQAAEYLEARRLERNGFRAQEKFLERTDERAAPAPQPDDRRR
jgi:hypothetical protein